MLLPLRKSIIILKSLTIICLASLSACTVKPVLSASEMDLVAISGSGKVIQKQPIYEGGDSTVNGWVSYVQEFNLPDEKNCHGIALTTTIEALMFFSACESGTYYLCPRGLHECNNEFSGPTRASSNTFEMRSSFAGRRYVLEVYPERLIYRIQKSKCLIKYPHGCMIKGFGWSDVYYFDFRKNKN